MQPSMFNVQVPIAGRDEVFLMNTFSDAQLLVSSDVPQLIERVARGERPADEEERRTVEMLVDNGFLVESRDEERRALVAYFTRLREDTSQMHVTVLTTLQCNFACDYCMQGDHGDHNRFAHKMSLDTARGVVRWVEQQLDAVRPEKLHLTFFGGEPLLNLPVMYLIAEQCHALCEARGIPQSIGITTNGLLLTPEIVDRLIPFGLRGVKVTLDGDRDTHNRMRPLRGGQGTFDRIVENVARVAGKVRVTIGGNFDESSVESYPALLDFLQQQEFADKLAKVDFKPIIRLDPAALSAPAPARFLANGVIPLMLVGDSSKPLSGACMTGAGAGGGLRSLGGSPCDSCHVLDEKMHVLREETRRRGFPTSDGVHMGPCEIHRRHAYTIGIDGSLYACPGFASEPAEAIGDIWSTPSASFPAYDRFARLSPLKEECGDCSFIPVCGGGCSVAGRHERGDLYAASCHKGAMEAALVTLAQRAAAEAA